jgi:hypothetical protein
MQFQFQPGHHLPSSPQGLGGLTFKLAQNDKIIRISDHLAQVRPSLIPDHIEDVQLDVREKRTNDPSLWRTDRGFCIYAIFYNATFEPHSDQLQNSPIADATVKQPHQDSVVYCIKVLLYVGVNDPPVANQILSDLVRGLSGASLWPESIRIFLEVGLEDRFNNQLARLLDYAIFNCWNTQRPLRAIWLRDHYP